MYIAILRLFKGMEVGGFTRSEVVGKTSISVGWIRAEDRQRVIDTLKSQGKVSGMEITSYSRDGTPIDCLYNCELMDMGGVKRLLTMALDITERKQAETQIKTSLQEKEVLLKEIHHRVKNNLEIISSLLELSRMQTSNQEAIQLLVDARSKVYAMAMIHKQLYQTGRFDLIRMETHIVNIVDFLRQAYQATARDIQVSIVPSDVQLTINQAIPCALVLNELLSNAFKHAFKNRFDGAVDIVIKETLSGLIMIRIRDNGVGIPENVDTEKPVTMGMELVVTLVQNQLNGTIQFERNDGTDVIMEFPVQRE
ncbi:MAG: PAS domain S-box protein [Deltaproteobacteria bacterium]|nr:PAS domain S-box protein [Deltaproteobacteria bacterium]